MDHSFQLWFVLLLNDILSISYQSVGNNIAILIDSVAAMQNNILSHFRKMYSLVKTQGISKSDFYDFLDKLGTRFFILCNQSHHQSTFVLKSPPFLSVYPIVEM